MTFASLLAAGGCSESEAPETNKPEPLEINNALTDAEKEAGILTAEVMWKMGRIGSQTLSADGSKLLYTLTEYNMAENRGITSLYLRDMATGEEVRLTDNNSTNTAPQWLDNQTIAFMSNRSGAMQAWSMGVDGSNLAQVTDIEGGIEGFGIAGDHAVYNQILTSSILSSKISSGVGQEAS